MDQYVIVGNGIAAAGCIEGIRSCDKDTKIVVISKENHPVYCRPLISYYLKGKTPFEKMGYRPESFYADNGCELLYDQTAEKIDPDRKTVLSSRNQEISYKALCIAAGSSPFVPPFEGLDTVKERYSFMTLDDALALEKVLRPDARVMIIGGGLIGLKCAEGLFGKVKKLIICDLAERVLSSILDDDTAPMVQKRLTDNGIDLLMGDSAVKFEGNRAYMKSGKIVDFDILVTAVGVRPNTALVSDAGGVTGRGIVIDEKMATSLPDVYSAGDCAEGFDISFGDRRVLALLPNAYMQGYTAGVNMAGGSKVFDNAIPMNSIGFFGVHIMTAGTYVTEDKGGTVYMDQNDFSCKKFFVQDGLLKGFILINSIDKGGIYTSLVRDKIPLDTIDFDLLRENPSFMAFSPENRKQKFGGVV